MGQAAKRWIEITAPRGPYPERIDRSENWLERIASRLVRFARLRARAGAGRLRRFVRRVNELAPSVERYGHREIREAIEILRRRLRTEGFTEDVVARSFALVRELAARTTGLRPFDVQVMGGWILLNGMVAEMQTGEGKTLVATLPACTVALAGFPVHVITVNDYLAQRDAEWMGPIYQAMGLSVGTIVHGLNHETRQAAYACDIAYCTNKEIVFDYLRDRILLGRNPSWLHLKLENLYGRSPRIRQLLLRGLCYGIVDEVDSVLVDEARTPLIISSSRTGAEERRGYELALRISDGLQAGTHYTIDHRERRVQLTPAGEGKIEEMARTLDGTWARRKHRQDMVAQALTAKHLFVLNKHYLLQDGKVQIVDEYTGRIMPDRSWEHGLHQAIEAKEDCPITAQNFPIARISYQRFFRRYLRLAGMTGTAREVAGELGAVYGMPVVTVAPNRTLHRYALRDRIFRSQEDKWLAIVTRIAEIQRAGRPVLVGTRSVDASEKLSRLLNAAGLPHRVLNARQDREEAQIIAEAGEPGQITVATNMAGRGTDICLAEGIAALGGLHVIATERHEARRIDRQLFGRCGRQGDPGTHEAIVAIDDELITVNAPKMKKVVEALRLHKGRPMLQWIGMLLFRIAQKGAERTHSKARRDLLKMDEYLESTLAFSGSGE